MLYELIAVVRPGRVQEVREIAKTTGMLVLAANGVVRGLTNWGTFLLPRPLRRTSPSGESSKYHTGHYFVMRFDAGARAQHTLRKTLGLDPRLLRFGVVRLGTSLADIKDVPGEAPWGGEQPSS